jgi:Prokaryotic E2 family E
VALPPKLEKEIGELRAEYPVDVFEDGDWINVVIPAFALGEGYSLPTSDLLIRAQRTYPDAGPDMFWLEVGVLLLNGQPPQSAEPIETYQGRTWRRFSWHRQRWEPSIDNLHGYLEFIRRRLKEKK